MVQVLIVRGDIGVTIYEAMAPSVEGQEFQVMVVRVDRGFVTYETMTPQCGRPVVQAWM